MPILPLPPATQDRIELWLSGPFLRRLSQLPHDATPGALKRLATRDYSPSMARSVLNRCPAHHSYNLLNDK
jgi:hypothetical protein